MRYIGVFIVGIWVGCLTRGLSLPSLDTPRLRVFDHPAYPYN